MGSLAQTDTAMRRKTVFLFDVDNTLLDNDRVTADLRYHLERVFVRQGHYAHDDKAMSGYRSADYTIERIADLVKLHFGEIGKE